MMTTNRTSGPSGAPSPVALVGGFLALTAFVVGADWAMLPDGEKLTREGGGIEMMSLIGYILAAGLYLWVARPRVFWAVPMVLLFMAAREGDLDKRFTSEGILSTKILIHDTALWEKLLALGLWALLAASVIALVRYRGPALLRALRQARPWALAVAGGILLAAFSKAIDGLARKLAPLGIDVSAPVGRGAGVLEELLEVLVPPLFMLAILWARRSEAPA
ncbi:hypothetical protein [Pseudoroseicyclus aestuarii]|uniref:Uncharacterized protein n=1 Tax=Pseudoroseicyclus aestuarii TaxID=1795041 RepID=A0A318SVN7_9RHOB|nr:hypothetical protein [Pseudoroseicyclus aestuarii]PYE83917.1 hypothetical protein DFP88_103278 [Pseudoroseicyclus aestuarii]